MLCGEERAESKSEALDLTVDLRFWLRALGSDCKNEIADTGGVNELYPKVGWPLGHLGGAQSRVTLKGVSLGGLSI